MLGITIMFTLNGEKREYQYDKSQKDIANAFWQTIVNDDKYKDIKGIKPDGKVIIPKKETEKCFAVQVVFRGAYYAESDKPKVYTYGAVEELKFGDEAIVHTYEGYKIVQVVSCDKIEKSALKTLTHGKTPQWIYGKFTRFGKENK